MFEDCIFFDDFRNHLIFRLEIISLILKFFPNMVHSQDYVDSDNLEDCFYSFCCDELDNLVKSISSFNLKES